MRNSTHRLELGKEYPSANEQSAIQAIEDMTRQQIEQNYQAGERPARRDAHAKHHGCVKGEFIVEPKIPEDMKVGIFQEPGKKFTACIRFSNSSGNVKPDYKPDARGMAIKLIGVEGEKLLQDEQKTQDFIVVNHTVFSLRNLEDYIKFFTAAAEAKGNLPIKFFFPGLNPFQWRLHEFKIFMSAFNKKVVSPLEIQYWSMTAYKFGDRAVKFSVKPSAANISGRKVSHDSNYLREAMIEHLNTKEARFDFLIQFQTDAEKMPIEDATIEWKSPYHKVATIIIPPQSFDSPEQMKFCENLSYTPWHALPEHQPLGATNRARKQIYTAISKLRHDLNGASIQEPTEEYFSALFGRLK